MTSQVVRHRFSYVLSKGTRKSLIEVSLARVCLLFPKWKCTLPPLASSSVVYNIKLQPHFSSRFFLSSLINKTSILHNCLTKQLSTSFNFFQLVSSQLFIHIYQHVWRQGTFHSPVLRGLRHRSCPERDWQLDWQHWRPGQGRCQERCRQD